MLTANLREKLLKTPTAFIADAMMSLRVEERNCGPDIRPVAGADRIVGTAVTISFRNIPFDPNRRYLEKYGELLTHPPEETPNPVIVISVPSERSHQGIFGGGAASVGGAAGYVGAVIEGSVRDTGDLRKLAFPVYSRGVAPGNIIRSVTEDRIGETLRIGAAAISPGDIIVADSDGVIVIDPADLEPVTEKAHAILEWEEEVYELVRRGTVRAEAIRQVGPKP